VRVRKVLLFFIAVFLSTGGLAAEDQGANHCEGGIEGHFIDQTHLDTLCFRAAPDGFSWILYYSQSDKISKKHSKIDSEILNSFEHVRFQEMCRDPDTGLDQLLMVLASGGSSNGEASDALFVYYDTTKQQFSSLQLGSQFVDNACSVKSARQRYQRFEQKNRRWDELYQSIRPPKASAKLGSKVLAGFEPGKVSTLMAELNQQEDFTAWEEGSMLGIQQQFYMKTLAENERWRIVVSYVERTPMGTSWGVLLLEEKPSEGGQPAVWKSFYDKKRKRVTKEKGQA